jgi:phage/plasmid-associated DNA primase
VIDLKTGELLATAAPDDLFTHACATEYDPDADIDPARAFFESFFPVEAYEDAHEQQALVRCLQQWFGYCLTLETDLEMCVWFHGPGSNGKTKIADLIQEVLGTVEKGGIHSAIPIAALCKARGENNGSLSDARHARHVTVSEVDKSTKPNEAALRSLISGETQHVKQMYGKEIKCTPKLKLSMFVNWLPKWEDAEAHANRRRHIYIPMQRIFVNRDDPADKIQIDEYRAQGKPDCLIAQKNVRYFQQHVLPHLQAFLRFFVLGAMEYYKNGQIEVPQSLKEHQQQELSDKPGAVAAYVEDHLMCCPDAKLRETDILDDFRKQTNVEELHFKKAAFYTALEGAIKDKKPGGEGWELVDKYNGRDGSGRKEGKGMLYKNLTFRDEDKAEWNKKYCDKYRSGGWVVTHHGGTN